MFALNSEMFKAKNKLTVLKCLKGGFVIEMINFLVYIHHNFYCKNIFQLSKFQQFLKISF